jgi:hypothetical protein
LGYQQSLITETDAFFQAAEKSQQKIETDRAAAQAAADDISVQLEKKYSEMNALWERQAILQEQFLNVQGEKEFERVLVKVQENAEAIAAKQSEGT